MRIFYAQIKGEIKREGTKTPKFSPAAPLKSYFTLSSAPQARKFWHFGPPKMRFYKGKTVQNRPDFENFRAG